MSYDRDLTKRFNELLDKSGIESMYSKIECAESKDILFSKFDTCYVSGFKYKNGEVSANKRYNREISDNFNKVWKYLQRFGYEIDMDFYGSKRYSTLDCDYEFHGENLPNLNIDINKFHNNLYKIKIDLDRDNTFYDMKDYKKVIMSKLERYAKNKNNVGLLRSLKLSKLIND